MALEAGGLARATRKVRPVLQDFSCIHTNLIFGSDLEKLQNILSSMDQYDSDDPTVIRRVQAYARVIWEVVRRLWVGVIV